jgi:hypothetical protein
MRKQTNKTKQNKVRKVRDGCKELEREKKLTRGELHGYGWYHFRHREEKKKRDGDAVAPLSVWATKENKMVSVFYSVLGFPTPNASNPNFQ